MKNNPYKTLILLGEFEYNNLIQSEKNKKSDTCIDRSTVASEINNKIEELNIYNTGKSACADKSGKGRGGGAKKVGGAKKEGKKKGGEGSSKRGGSDNEYGGGDGEGEDGDEGGGGGGGGGSCRSGGCRDGGGEGERGGGEAVSNRMSDLHSVSEKFEQGEEKNIPPNLRLFGNKKQRRGGEREMFNSLHKQSVNKKNDKKTTSMSVKKKMQNRQDEPMDLGSPFIVSRPKIKRGIKRKNSFSDKPAKKQKISEQNDIFRGTKRKNSFSDRMTKRRKITDQNETLHGTKRKNSFSDREGKRQKTSEQNEIFRGTKRKNTFSDTNGKKQKTSEQNEIFRGTKRKNPFSEYGGKKQKTSEEDEIFRGVKRKNLFPSKDGKKQKKHDLPLSGQKRKCLASSTSESLQCKRRKYLDPLLW